MKTIPLSTGIKIGDAFYKQVELREITTADLLDAEDDAPVEKTLSYSAALLRRQLVRAVAEDGREFKGPFSASMVRNLSTADFRALRLAQQGIAEMGEPASATGADSTNPSS